MTALRESRRADWLLCRAGALLCAIPLEHAIETMRALPVEPVAGAPAYVRGLSLIRGTPVPVIDTGALVGDRPVQAGRFVSIRTGGRTVALAVEAVLGIAAIEPGRLDELPPLLRDVEGAAIEAIGTRDAELLFFLRAARLVPDALLERLEFAGALS